MSLIQRLLIEYGALMLLALLRRQPPDMRVPYKLIAAAGFIMAGENHLELNLSRVDAAAPVVSLLALSTVAQTEATILIFFGIATPLTAFADRVGKIVVYVGKGGLMALLGGSAAYLAIAQLADSGTSLVGASMMSVGVVSRLGRKPLVPLLVLATCLVSYSILQSNYWSHSELEWQ